MDYTRLFLYKIQKTWRLSCIFGYPQPSRILNLEYMPGFFKRVNIYSGYWVGKKVLQMHSWDACKPCVELRFLNASVLLYEQSRVCCCCWVSHNGSTFQLPVFALLRLESFSSSPGVSVTTIFWVFLSHRVDYIWDEVRSAFFPPGARV